MNDNAAPSMTKEQAEIEHLFTYHAPRGDQPQRYERIREAAKALAKVIVDNTPKSADQSAAIRKLRECVHVANASIALEPVKADS